MASLATAVILMAALPNLVACQGDAKKKDNNRGTKMTAEKLEQMIIEKDWDALELADSLGTEAVQTLSGLMNNEDPEIRQLALNCLTVVKGDQVNAAIANALHDTDKEVRTIALQSLQSRYDASIADSLIANLNNDDPDVRASVALLLGYIGDTKAVEPIDKRLEREPDSAARENMELALAKMGNSKLAAAFAQKIEIPDAAHRYDILQKLRYIGDRSVVTQLTPALEDRSPAYNVGTKDNPKMARVCDAAINLIVDLHGQPFDFQVGRYKIYSDDEIQAALKFVESLKR